MSRERCRFTISPLFILLAAAVYFFVPTQTFLFIVASAAVHEMGHVLMIKLSGVKISRVEFLCTGVCITYGRENVSYSDELLITIAGPATGLIVAFLVSIYGRLAMINSAYYFAGMNLLYSVFNLIPARYFDGGRIVYLLAARLSDPDAAGRVLSTATGIFIILLAFAGFLLFINCGGNPTLLIIATTLGFSYCKNLKNGVE